MLITDLIFIFLFLPLSLILYYAFPKKLREYILLAVSLIFYACGSADYFLLLILSLLINIVIGYAVSIVGTDVQGTEDYKKRCRIPAKILLVTGICYNMGILGYYKYTDFALLTVGRLTHTEPVLRNLALPLGLSFFTFKAISYLVDIYRGRIQPGKNPVRAGLYLSFFAQIQSGPLSRYEDMYPNEHSEQNPGFRKRLQETGNHLTEGIFRFIIGFNKKILIANILANIVNEIFSTSSDQVTVLYAWTGIICYAIQLFFDFSGYSDMAIGISRMFGFYCPENFNYPYMTPSVSQFWRRWHMTLGGWFRDYIYFPLGGSRVKSKWMLYRNLFIVWMFTGIWHGASWNFICWGCGYFVAIAFEKATGLPERIHSFAGRFIYRTAALLFILFQWVLFRAEGLKAALRYLKTMFLGAANATLDARALFLIRDNLFFILLGILLCFPVMPWIEKKMRQNRGLILLWNTGLVLGNGFLFLWAVSYVVAGQNNPFAYAFF